HFHVLVRVPQKHVPSDEELLRRYERMYPKPTMYQTARLEVIKQQLKTGGPEAEFWRERQLKLMGDVSAYMKLVKQRFSIWFNRSHRRYGTLWSERFKSVLVESGRALQTMSAYIDLNCVRAGLVADPKDYRFCGYAEAVAGDKAAQSGLCVVMENSNWKDTQAIYRQVLFATGSDARKRGTCMSAEALAEVMEAGGRLPLATVLRCRVRYFSDGAVLGSQAFVERQLAVYCARTGRREQTAPHPLPKITDWGDIMTLRGLRKAVFG
ncbi:MAG TPA: transposase, partial [Opitutaceae bacterium]|nr:transposase [Opitutaceae bacterium]